ncbi:MAG: sugar ABC transporter permease, partial [Ruminococcus sp.]|nr:sugar ABC transporter permease [Ruminococcus sp.]
MNTRKYLNPVGVSKYTGLALISPFIIGAVLFIIYPFVCSFAVGLTDRGSFVGLDNFRDMLSGRNFPQA